jgi:spore coat protein CotH
MDRVAQPSSDSQAHASERRVEVASTEKNIGVTIVELLASYEETQPEQLELCLHDYVDVESLERILASENPQLRVSFTVEEYEITIDQDWTIYCRKT